MRYVLSYSQFPVCAVLTFLCALCFGLFSVAFRSSLKVKLGFEHRGGGLGEEATGKENRSCVKRRS